MRLTQVLLTVKLNRETHRITCNYSSKLQTAKETLNFRKRTVVEFTYGDFPCYLNVNREKAASSYHPWKCKRGKRLTITTNSFMKIYQLDGFCPLWLSG